jgi:transcriptional regulator with XRE-family HTH domain
MARKVRAYTDVGRRIAAACGRQCEIAKALRVSQQSVSKKLRGETAILLSDLEALSKHFRMPLSYFFSHETAPDLARALEAVRTGPSHLRDLVTLVAGMPDGPVEKLLALAKVLGQEERPAPSARVAEQRPRYDS